MELAAFPLAVSESLQSYVYRLIDPRNGETFYVGKGKGNRIFAHIRGEQALEGDDLDNKIRRIRDIRQAGLEVGHVIHRHGMNDATATAVEAALIDAYPGLTNIVGGHDSNDFGPMHIRQAIEKYQAKLADFKHRAMLISINLTRLESTSIYEAVRFAWRVDPQRAKQAELVLATSQGMIIGAFVVDTWLPATAKNFPGRDPVRGRFGFVGHEAPAEISEHYLRRLIPPQYRLRGAANPIRYTW
ncbi:MAG: hypothetical protein AB7N24_10070 [Dehalococcoidia bacterium]